MSTQPIHAAPATFIKFHQFAKLEDSKDGGAPTVWGVATWEKPDSDNEVCDYETAVPVYQAWSGKAFKRTKNAGQEPSLGNIRLQHGSDVGGKATKIEYNDAEKEIWLGSEPINEDVHQQLKKGYYTGYSQGGSYAWRACNVCDGQMPMQQGNNYCETCGKSQTVRYGLRRIAEVSYVDSPATGEGFEHVKANGSREILKFHKKEIPVNKEAKTKRVAGEDLEASAFAYVGDPEKTATWKFPIKFSSEEKTKRHIRNALARLSQAKGIPDGEKEKVKAKITAAAKEHGIDEDGKDSDKADAKYLNLVKARVGEMLKAKGVGVDGDLHKDLYQVSRAASLLEGIADLWQMTVWEREIEGDDSEVPDEIEDLLAQFVETFIAMATEEANELAARTGKTEKGDAPMTPEELELQKAAKKSLASHFAKASAHHEKMADHHEAIAEGHEDKAKRHEEVADGLEECLGKSKKADVGNDHPDASIHEALPVMVDFHKAMVGEENGHAADHEKCAKAHDKMADHYQKMAESHDEEHAKSEKAAALAEVEPPIEKTEKVKTVPTMDDDVKAERDRLRNTPEYKKSVSDIASKLIEQELAEKRAKVLVSTGTELTASEAEALKDGTKYFRVVPRDTEKSEVELVGPGGKSGFAGL